MNLERRPSRLFMQLSVLLPTLALSFGLMALGIPPIPRLLVALGFGMVMIVSLYLWQRRRG